MNQAGSVNQQGEASRMNQGVSTVSQHVIARAPLLLNPLLDYPFLDVDEGDEVRISKRWRGNGTSWLRLCHPRRGIEVDFIVRDIVIAHGNTYVIVSPSRHWNPGKDSRRSNALAVVGPDSLSVCGSGVCSLIQFRSLTEQPNHKSASLTKSPLAELQMVFGEFTRWNATKDSRMIGLESMLYVTTTPVRPGDSVPVESINSDGQLLVKYAGMDHSYYWQATAVFESRGRTYVALGLLAHEAEGLDVSPVVLTRWRKNELIALDTAEFEHASSLYLDACEAGVRAKTSGICVAQSKPDDVLK